MVVIVQHDEPDPAPRLSGWASVRPARPTRLLRAPRQRLYARLADGSISFAATPTAAPTLSAALPALSLQVKRAHLVLRSPGIKLHIAPEPPHQLSAWADVLSANIHRRFADSYALHEVLGTGSFATVYRATHTPTGAIVAVKRISTSSKRAQTSSQLAMELRVMTSVRHPGLMRARDVFHEKGAVAVVMDLMPGGSLKEVVCAHASHGAQEACAAGVALQVLRALAHLHARGIAHRDVKLENVLCADGALPAHGVKLGDFGFAIHVPHTSPGRRTVPVGTPVYVAPESARGEAHGEPVDVFAVGVMVFRMLSTDYPYEAKDDRSTMKLVAAAAKPAFDNPAFADVSAACIRFLKATLQADPRKRLSADGALVHPWLARARAEEAALDAGGDAQNGTWAGEDCHRRTAGGARWQSAVWAVVFVMRIRRRGAPTRAESPMARTVEALRRLSIEKPVAAISDASRRTGARIGASLRWRAHGKGNRAAGNVPQFRMPSATHRVGNVATEGESRAGGVS